MSEENAPAKQGLLAKASLKREALSAPPPAAPFNEDVREVRAQIEDIVRSGPNTEDAPPAGFTGKTKKAEKAEKTPDGAFIFPAHPSSREKEMPQDTAGATEDKTITTDEINDIQSQIEGIVRNKSFADTEFETLVPRKNELVFPLVLNALVLAVSALVIGGIAYTVTRKDGIVQNVSASFSSVEGELLRRKQEETTALLSKKEEEIANMRKQLSTLEQEQKDAAATFAGRYQVRESEFKVLLEKDVTEERVRLVKSGVSAGKIDGLLALYEKERFSYYQKELDKYRAQLDAERLAAEEQYRKMQEQYQNNIKDLNEERRLVQEELRNREIEIRLGADAQKQDQAGGEELEQAKARLTVLEVQRERNRLEENRITGMFNQVRNALQQHQYHDAMSLSQSLIQYLESTTQDTQDIRQQRALDMYLASSLAQIARMELERVSSAPELNTLRDRAAALEAENARLSQLNRELSQNTAPGSGREAEIGTLTARISQNEADINNLNTQIGQLEAENARLTRTNQELTQSAANQGRQSQSELTALSNRLAQLEAENARLTQGATQNQSERTTLSNRVSQLEAENARLTQGASQNQSERTTLSNRVSQLEAENARLSQGASQNQSERTTLSNRV
ncbi:MAG: hypothetical protein LBD24_01435 [Spirochaetaceae bacterium]|jgi:chromosome segregation ATPase|nr:hypothetical protein [Spirochaetaceae bacterium]